MIPSKKEFLEKNWNGEKRWRRVELNEFAIEIGLDLCNKDSNQNVFDDILEKIIKLENKIKSILSDKRLYDLYTKFIKQLPKYNTIIKNYEYDIDYDFFVKYNKKHFFTQTKSSFDFLEFFLENQTYKIDGTKPHEWIPNQNKYIFFHPNGKYCIM